MKPNSAAPSLLLVAITLACVVVSALVITAAMAIPSIGLRLVPGADGQGVYIADIHPAAAFWDQAPAIGDELLALGIAAPLGEPRLADWPAPMPLLPSDLTPEPDSLATYAELEEFFARQSRLDAILQADRVELHLRAPDGATAVALVFTDIREFTDLPDGFWVQLGTGVAGLLIAGWVWALRPRRLGPVMFVASAVGLMLATATSAIYANRELALDGDLFAVLVPVNHVGVLLFGLAMIGLLLSYPRQVVRPAWLLGLPLVLALYMALDLNHLGLGPSQLYLFIAAAMAGILVAIALQWWHTRRSPSDRAALGWLGLSVVVGSGAYTILGAVPVLLDVPFGLPQSHVTGVLIVIYIGLALGLSRYRLFELGDWAYRVLFYTVGALLLLAIDGLLLFLLDMDSGPALGVSLLFVGFVYLPARDWIWRRLLARRGIEQHELFSAALEIAFAPSPAQSASRWRALLQRLFDPLEIADIADAPALATAADDGLSMLLPSVAGSPPLRLTYPFAGRGLFSPTHQQLAAQLVALTERAEEGRVAYMRGVGEERRRMARDLHDDVGARLLTGLHTADEHTRPTLQAALSDIRAIVSGLAGEAATLDRVLAETRHEAARRLEAADIALDWPVPAEENDTTLLDYRLHKALTSAVREIVSNVVRHSGATALTVRPTATGGRLVLAFADDGGGLPAPALAGETPGYGLRNLRHRVEDVGGTLILANGATGTRVTLDVPLALGSHTPEPGVPAVAAALDSTP